MVIDLDRTIKETLSNRLLLLWLLYDAMKFKAIGDTKAHKLSYLSELSMNKDLERGFSYNFKKMPYGPYSDDLQKDADWIEEQKLIDSHRYGEGKIFQGSNFGKKLLTDFNSLFIRNSIFTQKISAVNREYASLNTYQLVDVVHKQEHPEEESIKIDELENGEIILFRLASDKTKVEFDIRPEELATLEVCLDQETYGSVMHAFESAKTKPLLSMDKVF